MDSRIGLQFYILKFYKIVDGNFEDFLTISKWVTNSNLDPYCIQFCQVFFKGPWFIEVFHLPTLFTVTLFKVMLFIIVSI